MLSEAERKACANALLTCMEAYSEDEYASGWYSGLERILWHQVEHGEADTLKHLANLAGGWWAWGEDGRRFVPLAEWRDLYAKPTT